MASVCGQRAILHETLRVEVQPGNLQSEARKARYAALAQWAQRRGLDAIATAHHADDQAETLLMRLNRASGLSGLAGTRKRGMAPGTATLLVRPLLHWRKADLSAIVTACGITPAQDPSNSDPRFDRARIRSGLAGCDWISVPDLAQSASNLADAEAALAWAAEREWEEAVMLDGDRLRYAPRAPTAIRLRILALILAHFGGKARGGEVARLADALEQGCSATLGGVAARPLQGVWVFSREPDRRTG